MLVDSGIFATGGIYHRALGVVHRAGGLTDEGQESVVAHVVFFLGAPFESLEAVDTFGIEDIGPCAVDACRDVVSVEVEHHVVFGCGFGSAVDELVYLLIVAVEEVDFEAFDAHFGVVAANFLEVALERYVSGPEYDANATFLTVGYKLGDIDFRNDAEELAATWYAPSVVHDDVFDTVLAGEVDVVFVGFLVDAGLEVDIVEVPCVPPVPGNLAGFDPRSVFNPAFGCELVGELVLCQTFVVGAYSSDTPGEARGTVEGGDVVFALLHNLLYVDVSAYLLSLRHLRQYAFEGGAFGVVEIEAGVVGEVAFGEEYLDVGCRLNDEGQESEAFGVELRDGALGVKVFE